MRTRSSDQYYSATPAMNWALWRENVDTPQAPLRRPAGSSQNQVSVPPQSSTPATDPDEQLRRNNVPLRNSEYSGWVPPAIMATVKTPPPNAATDSAYTRWWNEVVHGPMSIPEKIWITTKMFAQYVVWNYTDWASEFQKWDGTWMGLITNTHLLWRSMVVVALTVGLLEIAPLLEMLTRLVGMLFDLIRVTFELTGNALDAVWRSLSRVYDDLVGLIRAF